MKSGKIAKQAAIAFVKRTLERYQEFEETGKSCFTESLFKDMFLSGISHLGDGQIDSITDGEPGSSGEARASGILPLLFFSPRAYYSYLHVYAMQNVYLCEINCGGERGRGRECLTHSSY